MKTSNDKFPKTAPFCQMEFFSSKIIQSIDTNISETIYFLCYKFQSI